MKRLIIASFFVSINCGLAVFLPSWGLCAMMKAQTCLPEGITFSSQAALDAFPADFSSCTMILGPVVIEESVAGDIKNLNGLSTITRIGQYLDISDNNSLQGLAGLDNLLEIGEGLSISGNQALLNVEALGQLSHVGQSLRIDSNGALEDLEGFQSINRVFQDLSITNNSALRNLVGLDSVVRIDGQLSILSNSSLNNLDGLSSLESVEDILEVYDNPHLQSLSALGRLHRVGGDLIIDNNQALWNLQGLEGLQEVGVFLQIVNNVSLSSLNGLLGLRRIGGLLQVYNNFALTSLVGLDSIDYRSIENLALLSSANLTNCSVKSICDYLKDPANDASIGSNETGCNARQQILAACDGEGINSQPRQASDIVLFPNPSSGVVTIKGRDMNGATVECFDTVGKDVLTQLVEGQSFDVHKLPAGFYRLRISSQNRTFRKSLIKIE